MNGEQALVEIHNNLSEIRRDLKGVTINGCAKREGDLARMVHIEKTMGDLGTKMDRIFWTSLVTAGGIIAFLAKALLPYLLN